MDAVLFDLDNTLYPPEREVFALIDRRINRYMEDVVGIAPLAVDGLRRRYWAEYGATLQGLVRHYRVDPEDYLDYVHDVDVAARLRPDPTLRQRLAELPVRPCVFTNGSRGHAERVVAALGLDGVFEEIFDIRIAAYQPKPFAAPYRAVLDSLTVSPARCIMVEDSPSNLVTARRLGMATVLVGPEPQTPCCDLRVATATEAAAAVGRWLA